MKEPTIKDLKADAYDTMMQLLALEERLKLLQQAILEKEKNVKNS